MTIELMHPVFWLLAVGFPMLLALLLAVPRLRPLVRDLSPLAAIPALVLAFFAEIGITVSVPLLLETRLGVTPTTQVFLVFTALLWIIAGLYAQSYLAHDVAPNRFFGFYLVTLCGNLGLILARDLVSFYAFFSLMGIASYGLVIHEGTARALRAGRIYLILVLIGEALLLPVMLLSAVGTGSYDLAQIPAGIAQSTQRTLIMALALAGFGIKAGALPLHVWLPLAHPAAPTPASALLSGSMIKAGLLGWMLFLPLGEVALPSWGISGVTAGLAAAFYGVVVGLTQQNAKAILAYSSISQMGLMTIGLGIALWVPDAHTAALTAIIVYAAHHALAKGALFLGVGVVQHVSSPRQRFLVVLGLGLAALALSGAPLTSGAVAKSFLKNATSAVAEPWHTYLEWLLQLAAIGTTVLMGRFLFAVWPPVKKKQRQLSPGLWLPWGMSLTLVVVVMFALPEELRGSYTIIDRALSFSVLWPVSVGILLVAGVGLLHQRLGARPGLAIPEGDLLLPILRLLMYLRERVFPQVRALWHTAKQRATHTVSQYRRNVSFQVNLAQAEEQLGVWIVAGMIFTVLITVLLAMTMLG